MKNRDTDILSVYQAQIKKHNFNKKHLMFINQKEIDKRILRWLNKINIIFSYILEKKAKQFLQYAPYEVTIKELIPKNQWTTGTCVAINKDDGTLELSLNYTKLKELKVIPVQRMVWLFSHEFRHKIQLYDKSIQSVTQAPNWKNFNIFMQKHFKKDEDLINHIFHELNPEEVDANIFASELTGIPFNKNTFEITEENLSLLKKKK